MKIPYYKQLTPYTCGPACLRMAFEYFGIKKSERQIMNMLQTNRVKGTWGRMFPKVSEKYRFSYFMKRQSSIEDIKIRVKLGYVIILGYYYKKDREYHYAIFKKIKNGRIYLYDPWAGPNHSYSISYFNKIWKMATKHGEERGWIFGLKK